MKRVALALSALLLAACELSIASTSIDAGALDASGLECDQNPCLNGGTCNLLPDGFRCLCPAGYEGQLCETDVDDCAPNPCKNEGLCTDHLASYTCACASGFTGVDCSTNVDECADAPCENGGTCTDMVSGYQCDCAAGYSGSRCEVNVDDCTSLPCDNGAECQDEVNGFTCICKVGSTGPTCSNQVEPCSEDTCKNAGTCQDGEDGFTCTCSAGFNGVNCETDIDDCAAQPCQNGANCVDMVNGYTCQCPDGYEGVNCENTVDPCNPNPCQNAGSCMSAGDYFVCSCPAGYNGTACEYNIDDCSTNPCKNGGSCTDLVDAFMCTCPQGITGPTCNNEPPTCPAPDPCGDHGACHDGVNGHSCKCNAGFIGAACETNVDDCEHNPCGAHGTCHDGDNAATCTCAIGYTGPQCQTSIDDCDSEPCRNGGACSDLVNGFSCACTPGWAGETCEANIDECEPNPCMNGGTCEDGVNDYTCTCVPGYRGDQCETNECSLIGVCGNGTCDMHGGCICDSGWQGNRCDTNIDECMTGTPCLHGGACTDSEGSFSCLCATGYQGAICEACASGFQDRDDDGVCCAIGWAGLSCMDCDEGYESVNGLCQQTCTSVPTDCGDHGMCDHTSGAPVCVCENGYFGPLCDSLVGTCSPQACGQNGACASTSQNTYKCTCDVGYIGRNCELVDECAMAVANNMTPCQNGGACIDGDNTYTCQCPSGWIGSDCSEVDNCVTGAPPAGPCTGHGTCLDGAGTYTCTCSSGWLGTTCAEADDCVGNTCQHGVCMDGNALYTCDCAGTGYEGDRCQTKIDYCANAPCKNGGTCSDVGTTFMCTCAAGFSGATCVDDFDECGDLQADVCKDGQCTNSGSGVGYYCQCPDGTIDIDHDGTNCSAVVSLAAGGLNTCAITAAGSLHCWGDNALGELGQGHSVNPPSTDIRLPVRVGTGVGWQKVSVGNGHVCAIRSGHLFCWGRDDHRQVGGPTASKEPAPLAIRPDMTWNDVSVGDEHTCALSGTALYCWGNSADLQAGAASSGTNVDAPKLVAGTWTSLSSGAFHTCAISSINELRCWGRNTDAQLGGTQPVALPMGSNGNWTSVKAGPTHTCAIAGTHTYCWGVGTEGALGNGAFANSASAVPVSGVQALGSLATGENFSCGTINDADAASSFQIYCWGSNQYSELLTADVKVNAPQSVTKGGTPAWTAYAVGTHHMCAVDAGLVYCWGSNAAGVLGSAVPDPTPVGTAAPVKSVSVLHLARDACWPVPCKNGGACTAAPTGYTCDCAGTGFSGPNCTSETNECATAGICGQGSCQDLLDNDGYSCTCPDGLIDVDNTGTICASAEKIAGSLNHTCVLTTAKTLHCWGSNRYGQFGLGTVGTSDYYPNETSQTIRTPLRLKTVSGVAGSATGWTKLAVGEKVTCGTLPVGAGPAEGLYCWGDNSTGQIGTGLVTPTSTYPSPTLLDNTQAWTALSYGFAHGCAIASGSLYCWGSNSNGQVVGVDPGVGPANPTIIPFSLSTPVPLPPGETSWVSVAAGGLHTCAITNTQSTYCWGKRTSGQVGNGAPTTGAADTLAPTKVTLAGNPQGFTSIMADLSHTCGLVGTSAYCWGAGTSGAIGNGANLSVNVPTAASGTNVFSQLTLGSSFVCGLIAVNGSTPQAYTARCWGNNAKNLLLTAGTPPSPSPVNIPTAINTTRDWRVFDVAYSHACGVDNSDGKLYCWGDNGLESMVGQGKLGTVASSLLGNFDMRVVKTTAATHTSP